MEKKLESIKKRVFDFGLAIAWLSLLWQVGNASSRSDGANFFLSLFALLSLSWHMAKIFESERQKRL